MSATRLATAFCVLALPGLALGQGPASFGASAERVRVDVVVTRDGRPVKGLTKDHFDLADNGARQAVELALGADLPAQVIVLLDTSASVQGQRLEELKAAAHALIETLTERDCVALVTFDYSVRLRTTACAGREDASAAIDSLAARGTTALYDAVYLSLLQTDPRQGRAVLLVLSDGDDRASWLAPGDVLDLAKSVDATLYSVSLVSPAPAGLIPGRPDFGNPPPGVQLLTDLTRATGGRVFATTGDQGLKEAFWL